MISKEEAGQKLKKMGFEVMEDGSVITVLVPNSVQLKSAIKDVKEKLLEMDYTASFGIKQYKGDFLSFRSFIHRTLILGISQ